MPKDDQNTNAKLKGSAAERTCQTNFFKLMQFIKHILSTKLAVHMCAFVNLSIFKNTQNQYKGLRIF